MKKWLTAILTGALLLQLLFLPAAAVTGTDYQTYIDFLADMELIEAGEWNGTVQAEGITRGEAAEVYAKILSPGFVSAEMTSDVFKDVQQTHAYSGAIALVTSVQLMQAQDGRFNPGAVLTYEQAMEVVSKLLGYEGYADAARMSESEKELLLRRAGLYNDINYRVGVGVTKGEFAVLMARALETDMIYQTRFGNRVYAYNVQTNVTMLEKYLNVKVVRGVIRANKNTRLDSAEGLKVDAVMLDSRLCYVGNTNAGELLGYRVKAYVQTDSKDGTDTLLRAEPFRTDVLTISAEDLNEAGKSPDLSSISYYDSERGREMTAQISGLADHIYNGRMYLGMTAADLQIETGSISLIDNDEDGLYDVLSVRSYVNYVVQAVDMVNSIVYDKVERSLDLSEKDRTLELIRDNGRRFLLSGLKEWSVLSVYESKDSKLVTAVLSSDSLEGRVEAVESAGSRAVYTFTDGAELRTATVWCAADTPGAKLCNPNLNTEGVFYFDAEGHLAAVREGATLLQYGFLLNCGVEIGLSDNIQFKIVAQDGSCNVYYTTPAGIAVNDYSGNGKKRKGTELLNLFMTDGVCEQQLVQFSAGANGRLTRLNIAGSPPQEHGFEDGKFTLDATLGSGSYYAPQRGISYNYFFDENTAIFLLDKRESGRMTEETVSVRTGYSGLRGSYSNLKFYDNDVVKVAGAFVADITAASGEIQYTPIVFDKISMRINDKGETERYAYFMQSGVSHGYYVQNTAWDNLAQKPKKGDTCLISLNMDNEITQFRIFEGGGNTIPYIQNITGSGVSADLAIYYGTVFGMTNQRIGVEIDGKRYTFNYHSGMNIYEVTKEADTVRIGTAARSTIFSSLTNEDMRSKVIVVMRKSVVYDIVIYR